MGLGGSTALAPWGELPRNIFSRFLRDSVHISRRETSAIVNDVVAIVEEILGAVEAKDGRFDRRFHRSGSYIENLKVSAPDEFDFLVPLKGISLLYPGGWYPGLEAPPDQSYVAVIINRSEANHDLQDWLQRYRLLLPKNVMTTFRTKVRDAVSSRQDPNISLRRLQQGTPAVTISVPIRGLEVSVDLVPFIENPLSQWMFEWPRQGAWPSQSKVQKIKEAGVDLVAKHPLYWRYSFSRIERILLESIDADGGHRRNALRALKKVHEDYWKPKFGKDLVSYHLKMILFWACESFPQAKEWQDPVESFMRLVVYLERFLKDGVLPHYFLGPQVNLFKAEAGKLQEIHMAVVKFKSSPVDYLQRRQVLGI
ncbi:protein mab-21-like 3 [Rhinatrema bivittatum]|uniref:protein mab-21-like 3 n=1 Tax=Rhinatrema bivittatum TaxID=194408 RepID=UPI001129BBF5|nr:protein mab-21-like 3 [Rhinatrema bivittatum]